MRFYLRFCLSTWAFVAHRKSHRTFVASDGGCGIGVTFRNAFFRATLSPNLNIVVGTFFFGLRRFPLAAKFEYAGWEVTGGIHQSGKYIDVRRARIFYPRKAHTISLNSALLTEFKSIKTMEFVCSDACSRFSAHIPSAKICRNLSRRLDDRPLQWRFRQQLNGHKEPCERHDRVPNAI